MVQIVLLQRIRGKRAYQDMPRSVAGRWQYIYCNVSHLQDVSMCHFVCHAWYFMHREWHKGSAQSTNKDGSPLKGRDGLTALISSIDFDSRKGLCHGLIASSMIPLNLSKMSSWEKKRGKESAPVVVGCENSFDLNPLTICSAKHRSWIRWIHACSNVGLFVYHQISLASVSERASHDVAWLKEGGGVL